jgi:phospholipase/lecithinase/hemolysin
MRRSEGPGGSTLGQAQTASYAPAAASAAKQVSEPAGEYASTAAEYASTAAEYVADAGRSISEQSTNFAQQTTSAFQQKIGRAVDNQPLLVALAGAAAGAAIAATFAPSKWEKQFLEPAVDSAAKAISEAGERLKEAGATAGDRVLQEAKERGLSTDGLKDVAGKAADAFQKSFAGGQDSSGRPNSSEQNTPASRSGMPASGFGERQKTGDSTAPMTGSNPRRDSGF